MTASKRASPGARAAVLVVATLGALSLAASTSCVFLIDTVDVQPSCSIQGTSACASCMRTSCQAKIDACCGSITCAGFEGHSAVLDGLDRCGNGDKTGCTNTLIKTAGSFDTTGDAARACVKASCNEPCTGAANQ